MPLFKNLFLISCISSSIVGYDFTCFHHVYPFNSFKIVIDTCVRTYSDALVLHDCMVNNEQYDELLDVLVGRLIRLQSYIEQLLYAYKYEATVTFEELDYLRAMLDYLEVTIEQADHKDIAHGLNTVTLHLKRILKEGIGITSFNVRQAPLSLYPFPPLEFRLPRFV